MVILTRDMRGLSCTFRTKHPNDTNTYTGVIDSVSVGSDVVKPYRDIISYNAAVRQTDPSVSSDVTSLNYFIINVTNSSGVTAKLGFAEEWIDDGSFVLLNSKVKHTFVIYTDSSIKVTDIIQVNRNAGFDITEVTD